MEGKNRYFSSIFNGIGSDVNGREKQILFIHFQWNREQCEWKGERILFVRFQWNREQCEWKGKTDTFHPFSMEQGAV